MYNVSSMNVTLLKSLQNQHVRQGILYCKKKNTNQINFIFNRFHPEPRAYQKLLVL